MSNIATINKTLEELKQIKPWSLKEIWTQVVSYLGNLGLASSLLTGFDVIQPEFLNPTWLLIACGGILTLILMCRMRKQFCKWAKRSSLLDLAMKEIEDHNKKIEYWSSELEKADQRLRALQTVEPILYNIASQYIELLSYLRLSPNHIDELNYALSKIASSREAAQSNEGT